MKQFTRGSNVNISVKFYDSGGGIITPTGAQVTLSFVMHNSDPPCPAFITYPLTQSGTAWTYDWDSSPAAAGAVSGHAETNDLPDAAIDFEFRLTAGRANKELAGDYAFSSGY